VGAGELAGVLREEVKEDAGTAEGATKDEGALSGGEVKE
jgi:hypothetical protein